MLDIPFSSINILTCPYLFGPIYYNLSNYLIVFIRIGNFSGLSSIPPSIVMPKVFPILSTKFDKNSFSFFELKLIIILFTHTFSFHKKSCQCYRVSV